METGDALMILDDKKARNLANHFNIPITGTLGVIVKAKHMGLIDDMASILADFRRLDFRVPKDIESVLLDE